RRRAAYGAGEIPRRPSRGDAHPRRRPRHGFVWLPHGRSLLPLGAWSLMRDKVCSAALVRRNLNLRLVLQQLADAAISERLIVNTHGAGNLEALFIMGMRFVFRQHGGALDAPLDDLDRATWRGHKPAACLLTLL